MGRNISQILDEQIKRWYVEQKARNEERKPVEFKPERVIALSSAYGSNGVTIAHRVGEILGVPVYDREIVEHIATTKKVRVETVDSLDQRAMSAVDDYLVNLSRDRNFDQGDYMQALTRTVTSLWAHGSCVFVGRGAAHIISRRYALAVRTVGPWKHRVRRVQDLAGVDRGRADLLLERTDAERESFVRRFFGKNIEDPLNYDLIVNTGGLSTSQAAELIVSAFKHKFAED